MSDTSDSPGGFDFERELTLELDPDKLEETEMASRWLELIQGSLSLDLNIAGEDTLRTIRSMAIGLAGDYDERNIDIAAEDPRTYLENYPNKGYINSILRPILDEDHYISMKQKMLMLLSDAVEYAEKEEEPDTEMVEWMAGLYRVAFDKAKNRAASESPSREAIEEDVVEQFEVLHRRLTRPGRAKRLGRAVTRILK